MAHDDDQFRRSSADREAAIRGLSAVERLLEHIVALQERVGRLDGQVVLAEERLRAVRHDTDRLTVLVRDGSPGDPSLMARTGALEQWRIRHQEDATERQGQLERLEADVAARPVHELRDRRTADEKRLDQRRDATWKYLTWLAITMTMIAAQGVWELVKERIRGVKP